LNYKKEWLLDTLTYYDNYTDEIIQKKEATMNSYNYDTSQRTSATNFVFTNGTTVTINGDRKTVVDTYGTREYFFNGRYDLTVTSPATDEIYKK
jgi:hypothetical protein